MPEALFMVLQLDSKGAKGLAALLQSEGFFSGAVGFVRRTLARSVSLAFQIGIPRSGPLTFSQHSVRQTFQ